MLFNDSVRSFLLILGAAALLWFYLKGKLKQVPVLIVLGSLILFDLVSVDIKYVNKEDFTSARRVLKPFTPTKADKDILKDKSYYRVANFAGNPMQDGRTSYFHNSIGGYHAAKMKRYQELFDYQIVKNNINVLNMLNAKYVIVGEDKFQENTDANGNAWFVNTLKIVSSANEEILALDSLNTKTSAVINGRELKRSPQGYMDYNNIFKKDSTATISLIKNNITTLVYKTATQENQFAVFSEIYYKDGWNAYLDGVKTEHYQVNYVLRGMNIPKGKHEVVFKYEPTVIRNGNIITLFCYALLLLIPIGWFVIRKKQQQ